MTDEFGRAFYQGSNDTTIGVTKSYVRANYIESEVDEDFDMNQQYKIKNLLDPLIYFDAVKKNVDENINECTLLKIPTYESLTNDYASEKNIKSGKVFELATTKNVKDDISIKIITKEMMT